MPLSLKDIQELHEKRRAAINEARKINDENPVMDAETEKRFQAAMKDAADLKAKIDRELQLREFEAQNQEARTQVERTQPELARGIESFYRTGRVPEEFRNLQATGDDSQGAVLVMPDQMASAMIKFIDDVTFIRSLGTVITVNPGQSLSAKELASDPADADWTTELQTGSEDSSMSFGGRRLTPIPYAKRIKLSKTLVRGASIDVESFVQSRLAYKAGITEEKGFLTGNGANQPLGLFTASANGISTGRDVSTGNTTSAVTFDGLLAAKYALKAQYRNSPATRWLMSRPLVEQIAKLKDTDGQYLWQPAKVASEPDVVLGHAISESEYVPSTFTAGKYVGMFADFSNYWIAQSNVNQIQVLMELYAVTNQNGYILRREADGMPVLEEAFVRVKLAAS